MKFKYKVNHNLTNLGWIDFDLHVLPILPDCPTAQQVLPNSHLSKQNRADSGIAKIKLTQTWVREVMGHPYTLVTIAEDIFCLGIAVLLYGPALFVTVIRRHVHNVVHVLLGARHCENLTPLIIQKSLLITMRRVDLLRV